MNWFARMDFSEQYQIEDAASDKRCDDKSNSKETYRRCFINSTNVYYPLANEVAKGYSNATIRPSHPCEHSRINILQWILTKLGTYLVLKRIWNPIDFQGQRSRSLGQIVTT
jgi:hypothetical protein